MLGLFKKRSFENPNTPINAENLDNFIGFGMSTEAGIAVSGETAMRVSTVFACVRILAQSMATIKREIVDFSATGESQKVTQGPLFRALTIEPNEYMSAFDFYVMMQAHAELWGNAYAAIERNGAGQVVNLVPLISRNVRPVRRDGKLHYDVTLMGDGPDQKTVRLISSNVLHIRGMSLDGLAGMAPVAQGRESIGLLSAVEKYGARFFKNDARPGIVLETEKKISQDTAKRLKADWNGFFSGKGQHRTAVLEEGLKVTEVGVAPNAAQFLETRKLGRQEIAALFGVPLSMLHDPDAKFRAGELDDLRFTKYSLLPRTKAWEGEINRKLFPRMPNRRLTHDLRELERGEFRTQIEGLSRGVQNALFTPNEARERLGLPPKDGGDDLVLQQNMAGLEMINDPGNDAGNDVGNALDTDSGDLENEE